MEFGNEIWKNSDKHLGYLVSSMGRIKSPFGKILKKTINCKNGYEQVPIRVDRKPKTLYVHRLVAETFLQNNENKKTVNHKNGVRSDNRLDNLEWNTHSENKKHAFRTGLSETTRGSINANSTLTERDILLIRELWANGDKTRSELASMFSVKRPTIINIINGKTWKHVPSEYQFKRKVILNLENGVFYETLEDAASSIGSKMKTLNNRLLGRRKNNTPLMYV